MKESKLVSIVLPVYNGEKYLSEAIDSIIRQSYDNWELIIVNDSSTDSTRKIAEDYSKKDCRIYVINNESNLKLPASLNKGFKRANGEYLTWTSDDNILGKNCIKLLANYLDDNDECGLAYGDLEIIDEKGEYKKTDIRKESSWIVVGNVVGANFMYRRTVADKVGEYDVDLFLIEDYEYWLRIWRKSAVSHIASLEYKYRLHSGSLTSKRERDIIEKNRFVREKYYDVMLNSIEDSEVKKQFFLTNHKYSVRKKNKEELGFIFKYPDYFGNLFVVVAKKIKNNIFFRFSK